MNVADENNEEYEADDADYILGHVKSLMVRLSTRVSEV